MKAIPRPNNAVTLVIWIVIALGAIIRIRLYLACRALWIDESMLALNLVHQPLWELLTRPLKYEQAAPPGFLLLERLMLTLFGSSEYSLRFVPLVSGIGTLVVLYLCWQKK